MSNPEIDMASIFEANPDPPEGVIIPPWRR